MKQIKIFTLIACLFATSVLVAQDASSSNATDSRNDLQIGFKGGANYSNLYDIRAQNFSANPLFGPVFGGFLSVPIGTYLGIQPEVLYSAKGYSGQGSDLINGSYSYNSRLNYLDVPILLQFKPSPNLYLLGGPEYSYLLSSSYTFTNGVTSETTQKNFQNDNLRRNVFGLIFGFDLNFGQLTLGARVAWDLQDNNGDGTSSMPRYRNVWGQLTLGFRL